MQLQQQRVNRHRRLPIDAKLFSSTHTHIRVSQRLCLIETRVGCIIEKPLSLSTCCVAPSDDGFSSRLRINRRGEGGRSRIDPRLQSRGIFICTSGTAHKSFNAAAAGSMCLCIGVWVYCIYIYIDIRVNPDAT